MKKIFGIVFIFLSVGIIIYIFYVNSRYGSVTRPFSSYTLLSSSWEKYKSEYINDDGRVIDFSIGEGITTSEGQSYALLRAVWMDDKETFDNVWKWTNENLRREDDNLFGWRWGAREDGSYGFLPEGGNNSASDADSDIALSLILADRRWGESKYKEEAKKILSDLWEFNTATASGERFVIAGNWAEGSEEIIINPSYFAPYAWRIFADIDTEHPWEELVNPAYDLLSRVGKAPLDADESVGLPPDWVAMDTTNGELRAVEVENLTTNYSYDAIRTPWRIALDYMWNKDERAREYLSSSFTHLSREYSSKGILASVYSHDGKVVEENESPSMYATSLGYFLIAEPETAEKIFQEKIVGLYSNDQNTFDDDIPYYEQNWLWFGAALYYDQLLPFQESE